MMRKDKDYLGIIIDGKWLREFSLFFLSGLSYLSLSLIPQHYYKIFFLST